MCWGVLRVGIFYYSGWLGVGAKDSVVVFWLRSREFVMWFKCLLLFFYFRGKLMCLVGFVRIGEFWGKDFSSLLVFMRGIFVIG